VELARILPVTNALEPHRALVRIELDLASVHRKPKAPSPLRSAGALHMVRTRSLQFGVIEEGPGDGRLLLTPFSHLFARCLKNAPFSLSKALDALS
jgi:hypothetical protein